MIVRERRAVGSLLPVGVVFLRRTESVGGATGAGAALVLAGMAGLVVSWPGVTRHTANKLLAAVSGALRRA